MLAGWLLALASHLQATFRVVVRAGLNQRKTTGQLNWPPDLNCKCRRRRQSTSGPTSFGCTSAIFESCLSLLTALQTGPAIEIATARSPKPVAGPNSFRGPISAPNSCCRAHESPGASSLESLACHSSLSFNPPASQPAFSSCRCRHCIARVAPHKHTR